MNLPPFPSTNADVANFAARAREVLARPQLDPFIRTRLDAALGHLDMVSQRIHDLIASAEWGVESDPRPCRYRFEAGHVCGRPQSDLPSHGESFAAHAYAPERRTSSERRAAVRGTGQ